MTVRSSRPEPHVGHRWRSGVHGGRVEHWNAECVGGMSASAATASPPCSRSPWGFCMARPRPARLGGWPCGWITAPLSDHFTNQISSGASGPSSPSPRTAAERFNRTRRSSMVASKLRDAVRDFVASKRTAEPRSSSSGVARRDLNQARRDKLVSKEPGALQADSAKTLTRSGLERARPRRKKLSRMATPLPPWATIWSGGVGLVTAGQ